MKELIRDIIENLIKNGHRVKAGTWQANDSFSDYVMRVFYNIELIFDMNKIDKDELSILSGANQPWSETHFQERISGIASNPGESYKIWPYNDFKENDDPYMHGKVFSHTYMERFWPSLAGTGTTGGIRYDYGDLEDVIKQLEENPLTRQAYLPIFFPEDTGAIHKQRVPCTLGYYFYIRDGKLNCNYLIRSCDIFRHFRNDIYLTGRLMQHVAGKLGIECDELTMYIFNLHIFENDIYPLQKRERKLI